VIYQHTRTIVADPPWPYNDAIDASNGIRGAATQYQTMTVDAICAMFPRVCEEAGVRVDDAGAHLYLWTTNAFLEEGHRVCRAWGFKPKTVITWIKGRLVIDEHKRAGAPGKPTERPEIRETAAIGHHGRMTPRLVQQIGQGHYYANSTEHLILAVRGRLWTLRRGIPTAFLAPRPRQSSKTRTTKSGAAVSVNSHSEKPVEAYHLIESMSPGGYLEIFARHTRPGWRAWGNEVGKLDRREEKTA